MFIFLSLLFLPILVFCLFFFSFFVGGASRLTTDHLFPHSSSITFLSSSAFSFHLRFVYTLVHRSFIDLSFIPRSSFIHHSLIAYRSYPLVPLTNILQPTIYDPFCHNGIFRPSPFLSTGLLSVYTASLVKFISVACFCSYFEFVRFRLFSSFVRVYSHFLSFHFLSFFLRFLFSSYLLSPFVFVLLPILFPFISLRLVFLFLSFFLLSFLYSL